MSDSAQAVQLAGFTNVTSGSLKGFQAAGFGNFSKDVVGSQIAGFTNVATGNVKGVQIAGFLNAGKKITGSQIGFINVADSVTGVPVGFLSLVRHGYHHFEVWGGEALHTNVALKLGVDKFYNIFAASAVLDEENKVQICTENLEG